MSYPGVRVEGAILSPDILEHLEDLPGQKPADFGLDPSSKVKDEIARAWADAQDYWRIFQRRLETLKPESAAVTETRQQWVIPLLGLLGYRLEYQPRAFDLHGKPVYISHLTGDAAQTPVQIVGYREPAGLDRKPERGPARTSAHAALQEFLNLNEQLYGLVSNGRLLRLLRDSSRLIKLSYLEFDLDRIFGDALFSDFAVLFRLLHASRLPSSNDAASESRIERYHLLAAARRIAGELAAARTGEEQPSPSAYRAALREVVRTCVYGVDLNPLAVELCKVALWLEAHNPGMPLNFLDHHVKCGNAIVGFAGREEADRGVPDEAFAAMPGDDKGVAAALRKANKRDRADRASGQRRLDLAMQPQLDRRLGQWNALSSLPERTPAEIEAKKARFQAFAEGPESFLLQQVADIPIAQFYIPKTPENRDRLITDYDFRRYWNGGQTPQGRATALAWATARHKRFFHWFLEFPEVAARGGFDCVLGNPPYLGGQHLSGAYGYPFCHYVKWEYAPAGLSDLVVFFVRRIFRLLKPGGSTAFITTNSIKDGDIRKDGLEQVLAQGGEINMAVRGVRWPGRANLVVSLVSIHRGQWKGKRFLEGAEVSAIDAFLEDAATVAEPSVLGENEDRVYQGSIFLGDGFLLTHQEAGRLRQIDVRNSEVIFPVINGQEVNNYPDQQPGRSIINFHDWSKERAATYPVPFEIVEEKVKPERQNQKDAGGREFWWRFLRPRMEMTSAIRQLQRCFVAAATTKYLNFSATPTNYIFSHALFIFTTDRWDLYAVVQSTLHEVWARKYSGALETRLRYSPSDCFETFPFPEGLWLRADPGLAALGERYHEHRRALMLSLWLGLTDVYNLYHSRELTPERVAKVSKKSAEVALQGCQGLLELRRLHGALDRAVADAYGWPDLDLTPGFQELETLPENDRLRHTIGPAARKDTLRRLLALNRSRALSQTSASPPCKKKARGIPTDPPNLF